MNKELYVSVTPHETKVALLEDDSLAEVYFERENEYTLAGSIYKGRVTRVLPGMQSAFVDIGLERDAFLYVSDFLELGEDEDEDGEFGEVKVTGQTLAQANGFILQEPQHEETIIEESETAAESEPGEQGDEPSAPALEGGRRWRGRRRRRGRRGGRDRFGSGEQTSSADENKEAAPEVESSAVTEEPEEPEFEEVEAEEHEAESAETIDETPSPVESVPAEPEYTPLILPGESIARYNRPAGTQEETAPEASETREPREGRDRDRGRRGRGDRDRGRGRDRDRGDRSDRGDRGSREEYVLPENYTPIVLPGESISKYRGVEPISATLETEPEKTETEKAATEPTSPTSISQTLASVSSTSSAETPAPEASEVEQEPTEASASVRGPEWTAPYSAAKIGEPEIEEEPQVENQPEEVEHQPEEVKTEEVISEQEAETAEAPVVPTGEVPDLPATAEIESASEEEVIEELEAPAAPQLAAEEGDLVDDLVEQHIPKLGIPVPEPPAAESQPEAAHADLPEPELIEKSNGNDRPSSHQPGSYVIDGGNVEHEELDAEEADEPSYSPQLGGYRHEPTEESERNGENGAILSDTVRDTEEEEALEESEYEFGGDEFEESEMLADEESTEEPEAEEETAEQPQAESGQRERGFERGRRGRRPMGRHMRPRQSSRQVPQISELLKEGQEVLVQIAKEPIGKKGARITSHIALPGRFLVYMPTVNHIGVSRKISSDDERQRLKRIVSSERENGHGGFIVRTAAANIKEDELRADIRFLKHLWHEIRTRAEKNKAPSLIYHDLNLVERILRDQVTSEFSQIWVDSEQEYERVVRFASRFQPNLVRRIKLYTKETPLYEQFGISEEINKSLKSKVWLKSGGYIVINQTEALVAIDINTGKYVGKTTRLEDTIVKTNCDAVKEIVRQIRLRDLGGIIVIDFIDMDERKNRQKVMQALEEALKSDRAPSKVLQFNDFGLVAITRKRVKQSLERTLGSPCPYCEATGFVKSVSTVCNEIFVEMRKIRKHVEAETVTIRVNPEVAKELKSNNGKWIQEIEEMIGQSVLIKSDAVLHQEKFDIQF